MLDISCLQTGAHKTAYHVFGGGKIAIAIEMGLGAAMGEWWHVAEKLSAQGAVLLYERAGYASSEPSSLPRTPENIAGELKAILDLLPHEEKLVLIGHSQGGLYAQQFAFRYPDMLKGLILLDPLMADDNRFKELLTPEEFKMSGVDKFSNLGFQRTLAKLHLGFLIKAMMKNAPPFYYCSDFSPEAKAYILGALTKPAFYETAMAEYENAHREENLAGFKNKEGFLKIPLMLITHSSALAERETMEFGRTSKELAEKVERIWQGLMKEALVFSTEPHYLSAENSTHYIYLMQPELLEKAVAVIKETSE